MAQITKHVGRVGDRKIAVIFREVPGESHMALVAYTQTLNRHIHDALMECINSESGQQSENLADALNRTYTRDGKIVLQQLHQEGQLKKVQTEAIIMTPTPSAKTDIKLSDLNDLINKIKGGGEAAKEMADIDASMGLQDPQDVARRKRDAKTKTAASVPTPAPSQPMPDVQIPQVKQRMYRSDDMSDAAIAYRMHQQATKMAAEARGLLAESQRMLSEAAAMDPTLMAPAPAAQPAPVKVSKPRVKKAAPEPVAVVAPAPQPAKRGRPARAKAPVL